MNSVSGGESARALPSFERKTPARVLSHEEQRLAADYSNLLHREEEPLLEDFSHVSSEQIARDVAEVERVQSMFERPIGGERGALLEDFLEMEIDRSEWFGGTTFRTTSFDDYLNGVDLVIEWEKEDGDGVTPRLAVDVTTAVDATILEKKFRRTSKHADVRYFHSDATGKDLAIHPPRIVLAAPSELLSLLAKDADLARLPKIGPGPDGSSTRKDVLPPQAFADHPLQSVLMKQASFQLARLLCAMDSRETWDYRKMPPQIMRELQKFERRPREAKSYEGRAKIFTSVPGEVTALAVKEELRTEWKQRVAVYKRVREKRKMLEARAKTDRAYAEHLGQIERIIAKYPTLAL